MNQIVVVTGANTRMGRAAADGFARAGHDLVILSRNPERLERTAGHTRGQGVRALAIPIDVADAAAVEAAPDKAGRELGPIDIWINVAMASVFSLVARLTSEGIDRGTRVTCLGQVHASMSPLKRMRVRDRGVVVNIGSALAYSAASLQSAYRGAKAAICGFTASPRSEIIDDKLNVRVTMMDLPAANTPQFDWALNKTGRYLQPVPPIVEPEVAARAIRSAAENRRRNVWVGYPPVQAILGNRIATGLIDGYLAKAGYSAQLTSEVRPDNAPGNPSEPVEGDHGSLGRCDDRARSHSTQMFMGRHRTVSCKLAGLATVLGRRRGARRGHVAGRTE